MAGYQAHQFSPQSAIERLLGTIEWRRVGQWLAIALGAALLLGLLSSPVTTHTLLVGVLALLVGVGVLALAGLTSGTLIVRSAAAEGSAAGALVRALPEGVLVTGKDGRVVYANPAYQHLTGERADDLPGIEELFSSKVAAAEPVYRLMQAVKRGTKWQEEFRVSGSVDHNRTAAEEASWYRVSVDVVDWHSVDEPEASGPYAVWLIAEITGERRRQEEAFGKLQEIIDYLDQAPAGFFSFDAAGRIDYLNATLSGWLGLDLADAVASQLSLADIVSGDGAMLLAQTASGLSSDETRVLDLDLIRHDGTLLPVRLLHQSGGKHATPQSRTLVLNRAPGAEKSSEDLRAAEVRFARFFHSAPIAIATVDGRGRVGSTNAAFARMFAQGLAVRGDGEIDLVSLVNPESREEVEGAIGLALRAQVRVTPVNVTFGGEPEHTGRLYFSPVSSANQQSNEEFSGAILYAIDTTDQRSLEMQMVQGQKMQAVGQLAGGIAHDFNNLLTAIIHATDELFSRHRPTDPSFKDIVSIKQTANRAASLVRQILAFSRRQTLRPEILNLNDVISNLSIMLDRLLGDNIQLNMERSRDLWLVRADVTQFEQVILNLSVNARDAMPAGGGLTIATRNVSQRETAQASEQGMPLGEYVLIRVSDTGSGMTPEVMEKVFEPFFTTKGVGKGTGLGLSTVYGIVKQTGGFIYIDSEVGKGTTFRIYLPRHEEEAAAEEERNIEAVREKQNVKKGKSDLTGTETILLVEDEETVRAFSARALRKIGYEVFEAGTGVQALEVMNEVEGRIDLVVSDVMMPEMDGPTMAREMRRGNPELKIIFVSGYAQDVLDEDDDFVFLPKPYGAKDLAAKVREVLAT